MNPNKDVSDAKGLADKVNQTVLRYFRATDGATSTTYTAPLGKTDGAIRVVAANVLPEVTTASNATNFATLTLGWDNGAGGGVTNIAVIRTNAAALTAATATSMTITATASEVADAQQLLLTKTISGAGGCLVGAFVLDLVYQRI